MTWDERLEEALKIDISSYLSSQGIEPSRDTSRFSYYLSPLPGRRDSKPSFVVNKRSNRWVDYGLSHAPDRILSLVCRMENCTLREAVDKLLDDKTPSKQFGNTRAKKKVKKPDITIVSIRDYFNTPLARYINQRKLTIDTVRNYCKQIGVVFANSREPNRVSMFIGFKNNLGGYELRNKDMKLSISPKYYTIIGAGKDRYVFEGFMDFLSYLSYKNIKEIPGTAIVLNSLTLLPFIYKILRSEGTNNLYFDNDKAADDQIEILKKEKIPFLDHRPYYKKYNDVNEMLCAER